MHHTPMHHTPMHHTPMHHRFRIAASTAALLAITMTGCGSDASTSATTAESTTESTAESIAPSASEPSSEASAPTAAAVTEASSAETATAPTAAPPEATGDYEAPPLETDGPISADNSCRVEVTGTFAGTWENPGGVYTFTYGGFSDSSGMGPGLFALNCFGPGSSAILFAPKVGATIPPGPADYVIAASDNIFGGTSRPEPMQVIVAFEGSSTNWGPSEDGILHLTKFDETGIAGSFEVHVTDVLANSPVVSVASEGDAVLRGTFAYTTRPS